MRATKDKQDTKKLLAGTFQKSKGIHDEKHWKMIMLTAS